MSPLRLDRLPGRSRITLRIPNDAHGLHDGLKLCRVGQIYQSWPQVCDASEVADFNPLILPDMLKKRLKEVHRRVSFYEKKAR